MIAVCALVGVILLAVDFVDSSDAITATALSAVAVACTLVVVRDGQRTRRMIARPGENVAPMRDRSAR